MICFNKEDLFLVTGASSGIGEGISLLLNKLGATIIASGRNSEKLDILKTNALNPDTLFVKEKDLTLNINNLSDWLFSLKKEFGKFKGLICCAGITETSPLNLINYENSINLLNINYLAPIFLAKGFADRRINIGQGSSITFIASLAASRPTKGQIIYGGTKAALVNSMQVMSQELSPRFIRVNSISPALVKTPMALNYLKEYDSDNSIKDKYPFGIGAVADVASLVAFLVSDLAKWITGQNYILDGGLSNII